MHFLVIDNRFRVPVFVFLELDPRRPEADAGLAVHGVTLELAETDSGRRSRSGGPVGRSQVAIGRDPSRPDRFVEFHSDGHVRAAGFTLIEPRYIGPTWESYLSMFRPEGERKSKAPKPQSPPAPGATRAAAARLGRTRFRPERT
jgi:hypothetical protein